MAFVGASEAAGSDSRFIGVLLPPKKPSDAVPQPTSLHKADGSPYCADPNCVYCNELRTVLELKAAGKEFRLMKEKQG